MLSVLGSFSFFFVKSKVHLFKAISLYGYRETKKCIFRLVKIVEFRKIIKKSLETHFPKVKEQQR